MKIALGEHLQLSELVTIARGECEIHITAEAARRVTEAADRLLALRAEGRPIYGMTTGVGALETEREQEHGRDALACERQVALLRSHAAGVGAPMRDDQVRAMMAARAHALARGHSGVRPATLQALLELLRRGVTPVVPAVGSLGASDLAPLAHAMLVLVGEGRARVGDETLTGAQALQTVGLAPVELGGRDGLALINGLAQTLAVGGLAVFDAGRLVAASEVVLALSLVAAAVPRDFLHPQLVAEKRHDGQARCAEHIRLLLADSVAPEGPLLRAPLSWRYGPNVAGAARTALELAERVVGAELDVAVDNPYLGDDGFVTSNSPLTSGQELTLAFDTMSQALVALAVASERRTAALLDGSRDLPPFLRHPRSRPGVDSGLMIAQYTAAAVVAELRAHTVSFSGQSMSVSAGTEDQSSLCASAARQLAHVTEQVATVLAIELMCAGQAIDVSGRAAGSDGWPPALSPVLTALRARVPTLVHDRILADDIVAATTVLAELT